MNDDELDAIRARAEAATEGPWEVAHRADLDWLSQSHLVDSSDHEPGSNVRPEGETDPRWSSVWPCRNAHHDAEFIAHAREDVPALLDEIDRLAAALDRVRALDADAVAIDPETQDYAPAVLLGDLYAALKGDN